MDLSKVEAVADWKLPTTVSELRSFLGFASYYRRFVGGWRAGSSALSGAKRKGETYSIC